MIRQYQPSVPVLTPYPCLSPPSVSHFPTTRADGQPPSTEDFCFSNHFTLPVRLEQNLDKPIRKTSLCRLGDTWTCPTESSNHSCHVIALLSSRKLRILPRTTCSPQLSRFTLSYPHLLRWENHHPWLKSAHPAWKLRCSGVGASETRP